MRKDCVAAGQGRDDVLGKKVHTILVHVIEKRSGKEVHSLCRQCRVLPVMLLQIDEHPIARKEIQHPQNPSLVLMLHPWVLKKKKPRTIAQTAHECILARSQSRVVRKGQILQDSEESHARRYALVLMHGLRVLSRR